MCCELTLALLVVLGLWLLGLLPLLLLLPPPDLVVLVLVAAAAAAAGRWVLERPRPVLGLRLRCGLRLCDVE